MTPAVAGDETKTLVYILDRLGVGAMGVVFLAHDPELDRELAIKMLCGLAAAHAVGLVS